MGQFGKLASYALYSYLLILYYSHLYLLKVITQVMMFVAKLLLLTMFKGHEFHKLNLVP